MALRFLHAKEDVIDFIDYLYAQGYSIARSGGVLEGVILDRQAAQAALISDLVLSMHGVNYWIVTNQENISYILLELESCGRESHPRSADRAGRYSGIIAHCYGREKTEQSENLMKSIRRFFRKNYSFQHCQRAGRDCAFFGPHYQKLDEAYTKNPDPSWLCPGYVRMVGSPDMAVTMTEKLKEVLPQYPLLTHGEPICKHARDHKEFMEVYVSFLWDHRKGDLSKLNEFVSRLDSAQGCAKGRDEKRYMIAEITYQNSEKQWSVYGLVDNEWKGFGNFGS